MVDDVYAIQPISLFLVMLTVSIFSRHGLTSHNHNAEATASSTLQATGTTTAQNYGGAFIRYPLTCPDDLPVHMGLSWRDIRLGVSGLGDVDAIYGVIASRVDPIESGSFAPVYEITLTDKAARDRKLPMSVEVCVVHGRIAVLALSGDNNDETVPFSVKYWVQRFGPPNIVTWSYMDWTYRNLIWSKIGLALEARIETNNLSRDPDQVYAEAIIYFPPAQSAGDLSSWPFSGLRHTPPNVSNDTNIFDENPFDFNAMLGAETPSPIALPTQQP